MGMFKGLAIAVVSITVIWNAIFMLSNKESGKRFSKSVDKIGNTLKEDIVVLGDAGKLAIDDIQVMSKGIEKKFDERKKLYLDERK